MKKSHVIALLAAIVLMVGILCARLNLSKKASSEPEIGASHLAIITHDIENPEDLGTKATSLSRKPVQTEVVAQEPPTRENLSKSSMETFDGRSGSLAEVLRALNMSTDLTRATDYLKLNPQQECRVSVDASSTGQVRIELSEFGELSFRKDLRVLVGYKDRRAENIPSNLTHEDAVDPEFARTVAQEFLTLLGFEDDLSNVPPELMDSHNQSDLFGARWAFRVFKEYQGFRVKGHTLVAVSAYSGDIDMLVRTPFIVPENMEVRVHEKEALNLAARFAEGRGLLISRAAVTDKWITFPTTVWEEDVTKRVAPDRAHPRPAYEVFAVDAARSTNPADYKNAYYYYFYVDCYTGTVIGGGGRDSGRVHPEFAAEFETKLNSPY